ncbi:unnamed protein product [Prorocentrum cordatum]|uniref:Uncharacterized protein n=1 Tax=Prorocentrum cordatum TaxID=2364126 RepID=A0ABN9U2J5_9DINO|nr:unnamed protein product [Polarella glacialis]
MCSRVCSWWLDVVLPCFKIQLAMTEARMCLCTIVNKICDIGRAIDRGSGLGPPTAAAGAARLEAAPPPGLGPTEVEETAAAAARVHNLALVCALARAGGRAAEAELAALLHVRTGGKRR